MIDTPILTKHDDGTITVQWPVPRALEYPVSSEMIEGWVSAHNERAQRINTLVTEVAYWKNEYCDAEERALACERAAAFAAQEAAKHK